MAKPEWGTKRRCTECGAVFYDMRKKTFACPKCGAEFDGKKFAEVHAKAVLKQAKKAKDIKELDDDALIEKVVNDDVFSSDTDGENQSVDVLEDASELGNDDHDMAGVFDNIDEEEVHDIEE